MYMFVFFLGRIDISQKSKLRKEIILCMNANVQVLLYSPVAFFRPVAGHFEWLPKNMSKWVLKLRNQLTFVS